MTYDSWVCPEETRLAYDSQEPINSSHNFYTAALLEWTFFSFQNLLESEIVKVAIVRGWTCDQPLTQMTSDVAETYRIDLTDHENPKNSFEIFFCRHREVT